MSASTIALLVYLIVGILFAIYIFICHISSTWKYIKQLYTARYLTPTRLKTYFGFQYWWDYDSDSWIEVFIVTTLRTFGLALGSIIVWPVGILFILNNSIVKARERLE